MRTVAALYVDPRGPYPKMQGVDCWDEARDARLYGGPHPVVAHPPCGSWGSLAHQYTRDDADCGPRAVAQVRAFGGVLEHPARSRLWKAACLPDPGEWDDDGLPSTLDVRGGFSLEVEQVAWGHVARKKTWLYLVGIERNVAVRGVLTGGVVTHWCSGFRSSTGRNPKHCAQNGCAVPPGIKVCSAQQRRRTPPLFAEWLVSLARTAQV